MTRRHKPETTVRDIDFRTEDTEDRVAEHVGAPEAARMLGVNQRAVRNLIARGRLEVKREGEGAAARLVVSLASVERLRLERRAAGKNSTA